METISPINNAESEQLSEAQPAGQAAPVSQPHNLVFISYSRKDEAEKEQLMAHLAVIQQEGLIDLWSEDRIKAGADWQTEIRQAIARARAVVLLISANFLTSDFVSNQEIKTLLQRHGQEGLPIFPVIAKASAWQLAPWLAAMRVYPPDGQPIWSRPEPQIDIALAALAEEVARLFLPAAPSPSVPLLSGSPSPPVAPPSPPGSINIRGNVGPGAALGAGAKVEAGNIIGQTEAQYIAGGDIIFKVNKPKMRRRRSTLKDEGDTDSASNPEAESSPA